MKTQRLSLLLLASLLVILSPAARALGCVWNGTTGNWATASNWNCGVAPNANDDVTINVGVVTLNSNTTVLSLTLAGGTLQGTHNLTVTGPLTFSNGAMRGTGTTTGAGPATLGGAFGNTTLGRPLVLAGSATWPNGYIPMESGAVLRVAPGGTLNVTADGYQIYRACNPCAVEPVLDVDGTFHRSAGAGPLYIIVNTVNDGTISVGTGQFYLGANSTNNGLMTVSNGAEIEFTNFLSGGNHTNASSGVVGGTGTVEIAANGGVTYANHGTFGPGLPSAPLTTPGLLTYTGNYTSAASTVLDIDLGGTTAGVSYDQLAVTGSATLGGTLHLGTTVGASPSAGSTFRILTAASVSGTFATVVPPFGYTVSTAYNPTSVVVTILTVPNFDLVATNTTPLTVAAGGAVSFSYSITNNKTTPITGNLFSTASPGGFSGIIRSGTLPGGVTVTGTYTQQIPGFAPLGAYTYTLRIGQFPNVTVDSEVFTITVTPAPRPAAPSESPAEMETWAVTDAAGWGESPEGTAAAPSSEEAEAAASTALPEVFALHGAYPNPFRSSTSLSFDVPEETEVRLEVVDLLGRRVALLVDGRVEAGRHTVRWEATGFASGVYLVRFAAGNTVQTQRLTLVR